MQEGKPSKPGKSTGQRSPPRRLNNEALWQFAVKALAGRAQSIGEVRQKLRMKAECAEDVDSVLVRLKEYGYLDDRRFADGFANARLQNQGFGKTRVLQDLRRRRVAPAVADQAIDRTYKDADETVLIEQYIRRKYRTQSKETLFQSPKDLAAAYRRLLRAGFRSAKIIEVLKRFAKDPDLLDNFEIAAERAEE